MKEDVRIDNHDNHSCASPDTSPIHDEGILVKEDTIIKNHEITIFHYPPLPWEDIIIENTLPNLHSSPKTSRTCENSLVKEDTIVEIMKIKFVRKTCWC